MTGWVKIHRALCENKIWTEKPFSRGQAWVDMILLANHKPGLIRKRGVRVDVKRGQVGVSIKGLADRWGWSRGKVRRFILELEMEHQIEHQNSNVTTLITIINYDKYQDDGHQNGQQTDSKRTANGHKQECKEGKEDFVVENDDQANEISLLAEKLKSIVTSQKKINVTGSKFNGWKKSISGLVNLDGITVDRIDRTLTWYEQNAGGEYIPVIESGRALREKFTRLEDAMNRNIKKVEQDLY